MNTVLLACPKCNAPLDLTWYNREESRPCPGCSSRIQAYVFPAFFRASPVTAAGELLVDEGEASCFFHPQKRAAAPCDSCGRFMCALCDVELNGRHFCPDCVEKGVRKKKLHDLENRRYLYDTLAFQLALVPTLFAIITFVTAPAALYVVIRYWKAPLSLVRRSRWRFIVAGVVALAQIAGWVAWVSYIWLNFGRWER